MDFPEEILELKLSEVDDNEYLYGILFFSIFLILGYMIFNYFNTEDFFERMEDNITDMKENLAYYTNNILLQSNMEGDAIKSTHLSSI
jgi:hypothetical protein